MTAKEVRNIISRRLHGFIGQPVILHEQDVGEPAPPLLYYRFISPLIPLGGASIWHEGGKQYRREPTETTMSITAVSYDRNSSNGYIHGDDEALELAERAISWMLHIGRHDLLLEGITIVEISNVQCRSNLMINEVARQYGFDVRLRFERTTTIDMQDIKDGNIKEN